MKKKNYLKFYEDCMQTGELPSRGFFSPANGLCYANETAGAMGIFLPTEEDFKQLKSEGFCIAWWGSGLPVISGRHESEFTPLRQTIVLFLAAMNDEL